METTKQFNNLAEQIEYGALANSCGFGQDESKSSFRCIADEMIRLRKENCLAEAIIRLRKETALADEIKRLREENEDLKRKVQLQELGGYYCHTRPAPDCEINTDDAAFDHYWSVQDKDLTLWKVPRHLADVPSAQTGYHGAVEQAFYDECFGEEYGKLKWMRVREMKQADLIKAGWQPKTDEDDGLCGCAECEECPSHINPHLWAETIHGAKPEKPEPICCVRCDEELDPAKKEVCPREWEGDSDAPMCADCWDLTEEEEDAEQEAEEEDDE